MTDITLEQRARELLAAEYERDGLTYMVDGLLHPDAEFTPATTRALRAIEAALRLSAGADEPSELRHFAKRNLRKLIELGSTDKALMLSNLEELS